VSVAKATAATTGNHDALSFFNQVSDQILGFSVAYNRATRDFKDDILTFGSVHFLASTGISRRGFKTLFVAIFDQGILVGGGFEIDTAATSTVPAVGTAERSEFFVTEVNRAIPTITRLDINFGMIVKHDFPEFLNDFLGSAQVIISQDSRFVETQR
jgi:hypothetical protein